MSSWALTQWNNTANTTLDQTFAKYKNKNAKMQSPIAKSFWMN